jgi:heme/copper-type cytochrome/quinol oxidase subunit 1
MKNTPYHFLLILAIIQVLASFFIVGNSVIDIHLHDTYYVLTHIHLLYFFAFFLLILWVVYIFTYEIVLSKKIAQIHIYITIIVLLIQVIILSRSYFDSSFNSIIAVIMLVFTLAQLLFITNVLGGIIKKIMDSKNNNPL